MSLTVNINNLSLCHTGSGGISAATIPDVCKTPSPGGPVPIPYPNVALASDLAKGTKTVKADGGNMCANYGSEFSKSTGDEPGTLGGVKSGTFTKEATWITYSFDVKLEGKGACRLTDKMFHNHENTVNMGGLMQAPLEAWPELIALCVIICACDKAPTPSASGKSELKEECVKNTVRAQSAAGVNTNMHPEINYDMTKTPPVPLLHRIPGGNSLDPTESLITRMIQEGLKSATNNYGIYQVRRPDVVIARTVDTSPAGAAASLTAPNLKAVVEIKFNNQPRDLDQIGDYRRIVGGDPNRVVELDPKECLCQLPDPKPVLVRKYEEERERQLIPSRPLPQSIPGLQPAPSGGLLDLDTWSKITGLTGTALILYLIVSEGSRVIPFRNLVPVP